MEMDYDNGEQLMFMMLAPTSVNCEGATASNWYKSADNIAFLSFWQINKWDK